MTSRRINAFLWTGTFVLFALTAAAIAWTFLNPIDSQTTALDTRAIVPTTSPTTQSNLPPLADLQTVFNKPLRQSASGITSQTVVNAAANISNDPPLTLVGTIGNSLAMLRTREGKIELKAVGESISGMTVVSITPLKVDVRYNGRLISLDKLPRRG